jgi:methionine synthase I (cobalamin-dependent)
LTSTLDRLLEERGVLLADGGMGTGLFAQGLTTGDSPEIWNVERPDAVRAVHHGFVEAGSDVILTNSFGGNRRRLALHGAEARVGELNRAAARVAREATDDAGRPVLVAGSMGPTGDLMAPLGPLTAEEAEAVFAEQAAALAEGGVDLLWIETMSAPEEVEAAVRGAAAAAGLPVVTTMSFDTNGRTMMGVTPAAAVSFYAGLPARPVAYGANCGIGPAQLLATLLAFREAAPPGDVIVAKVNCGIPEYRDGHIHYSGTPEVMAAYARLARDAGARIVGGCCGTQPVHLRAMRAALDAAEPGPPPSLEEVAEALGPIAAPAPAPAAEPAPRRRRARG